MLEMQAKFWNVWSDEKVYESVTFLMLKRSMNIVQDLKCKRKSCYPIDLEFFVTTVLEQFTSSKTRINLIG